MNLLLLLCNGALFVTLSALDAAVYLVLAASLLVLAGQEHRELTRERHKLTVDQV